ncbi:MAG: hypothetical protein AB7U81_09435 [Thiohalomonadaceae bacterium]
MKRFTKLFHTAVLVLTLSAPAVAAGGGRVPMPQLPEAKGDQCVEDTDVMRRKHMDYLMVHRDKTMREGVRTPKHSLKECLECHASAQEEVAAGQDQGQHFCKSCHMYAGVKIDCFECHATRPEKTTTFHPIVTPGMEHAAAAHQPAGELLNQLAGVSEQTGATE